jgi:hypothetical protein
MEPCWLRQPSEEAVTHHVVGKQKKEECQDNDKQ